jgi:hypothetical protein
MTATERLRAERRIDELLAAAFKLRMQLRIDEYLQAGEEVPAQWRAVQRVADDRHELAKAMAEAVGEWE